VKLVCLSKFRRNEKIVSAQFDGFLLVPLHILRIRLSGAFESKLVSETFFCQLRHILIEQSDRLRTRTILRRSECSLLQQNRTDSITRHTECYVGDKAIGASSCRMVI
jgi:hypothetical protein